MHILPGFIALALLTQVSPVSAADPRIKQMVGLWQGAVVTNPGGCSWKVDAKVTEKLGYARGTFSYTGPCSSRNNQGSFTSGPAQQMGCFLIDAIVPGMPKLQLSACFDRKGDMVLTSMLFKGTLMFTEKGRLASLNVKSMLGTAAGKFKKMPASTASKGDKNAGSSQARPLEVHGGSD